MQNKIVIITGATSGIGKALAIAFGQAGAKVVITGRNPENLAQTSQELINLQIVHHALIADASVEEDNKKMVQETITKFGGIDVLINNAGMSMRAMFEDVDLDVIRKLMDINFYGAVYATKYALPYILASKGSIVAISSINGHRGTPARTGYTASKFAMNGFFEALRTEVMYRGVHILVASPGFTESNIRKVAFGADGKAQGESPRKEDKMMSSEMVAQKILRAVQKRKRDLVLTTQGKLAVWLNKFFPSWVDKLVYNVMKKEPNSPLKD
jgi:short-subunit dehydrogenase